MQKLNYSDEDIYVCFVRGKEAPKSIIEASETTFDPDRRISKRSRKTNSGNQISLRVSGSTTIYQLKMMIWESFGVCYDKYMHPCMLRSAHAFHANINIVIPMDFGYLYVWCLTVFFSGAILRNCWILCNIVLANSCVDFSVCINLDCFFWLFATY